MPNRGWGVKVIGTEDAVRALFKVGEALADEKVRDVLMVPAQLIRDIAKRLVNLGDGMAHRKAFSVGGVRFGKGELVNRAHLRDAIFAARGKSQALKPSVIAGVDLKREPAAHLVEFGHGGPHPAPPHPFLRPAIDAIRSLIPRLVADGLLKLLQSAGIKTS